MLKKNIHLFLSPIINESRLIKEASYLLENKIFDAVEVVGLWDIGLNAFDKTPSGLEITRCVTQIKRMRAKGFFKDSSFLRKAMAAFGVVEYFFIAARRVKSQKPSHISVHNLFLLPIGVTLCLAFKSKLIYVPHELETNRTGLNGVSKIVAKWVEATFIKYSSSVITVCQPIANWYIDNYHLSNVHVVRNMPRICDLEAPGFSDSTFHEKFKIPEDTLIYIYQGLIEKSRGCEFVRDAFIGVDSHIVFMGYGSYVQSVLLTGKPNIHYQKSVSMSLITTYTAMADIGIFVAHGSLSCSYEMALPNKFFEYLHAGLPVLVSSNFKYFASIVEKNAIGWVIDSSDLSNFITHFSKNDLIKIKKNVYEYAKNCVWEFDAKIYHEIYC